MTATLHCPVCRSADLREVMRASNDFPIMRCADCGLAFTDDRQAPPPDQLYPAFDQSEEGGAVARFRKAFAVFLRQREAFVRSVKPSGRLLDYGCGNGAFARHMGESGYDAVGLEPFSLGHPERSSALTLIRGPLASHADTLGQFDVITMWHVLEHIPRPVDVLKQLAKHLKPDGVLVVSVPNFASWQSAIFTGSWFHLDPPRHLIHFEERTLENTLNRAGLVEVGHRHFLPEYGGSGWVQSALNRVLPHHNYLYELVKDRGALKDMPVASSAAHFALSMLMGGPLFALSLPLEAAASARGKGAALTVAYRKGAA